MRNRDLGFSRNSKIFSMMDPNNFRLGSWNVKGVKSTEKESLFWQLIRREKKLSCWQKKTSKKSFGKYLVFYVNDLDQNSGVMTLVHIESKSEVVYRHSRGKAIAIKTF